ncbi:hypothetical protein P691DRAFT_787172 [Macrolepiota fuliginosa MF-IS2]|uniref:Uncharacterized protein n=1 Tax=Macrolepiota fuliginosa MF-IS2 TaxID=1400762 RepID=A0A9P5X7A9_9AGAR|nr:hypothetical protein P691DRAFT_787172 [Macrolepiota fuliginosa MF-IS2]
MSSKTSTAPLNLSTSNPLFGYSMPQKSPLIGDFVTPNIVSTIVWETLNWDCRPADLNPDDRLHRCLRKWRRKLVLGRLLPRFSLACIVRIPTFNIIFTISACGMHVLITVQARSTSHMLMRRVARSRKGAGFGNRVGRRIIHSGNEVSNYGERSYHLGAPGLTPVFRSFQFRKEHEFISVL